MYQAVLRQLGIVAIVWIALQGVWWSSWLTTYEVCTVNISRSNWQVVKSAGLSPQILFAMMAMALTGVSLWLLARLRASLQFSSRPTTAAAILYALQLILILFAYDCLLSACPSEHNLMDNAPLVIRDLTLALWFVLAVTNSIVVLRATLKAIRRAAQTGSELSQPHKSAHG